MLAPTKKSLLFQLILGENTTFAPSFFYFPHSHSAGSEDTKKVNATMTVGSRSKRRITQPLAYRYLVVLGFPELARGTGYIVQIDYFGEDISVDTPVAYMSKAIVWSQLTSPFTVNK